MVKSTASILFMFGLKRLFKRFGGLKSFMMFTKDLLKTDIGLISVFNAIPIDSNVVYVVFAKPLPLTLAFRESPSSLRF